VVLILPDSGFQPLLCNERAIAIGPSKGPTIAASARCVIKRNAARLLPATQRELREADVRRERRQIEQRLRQLEKFEVLGKLAGGVAQRIWAAAGFSVLRD
jgi:hypothetical protein